MNADKKKINHEGTKTQKGESFNLLSGFVPLWLIFLSVFICVHLWFVLSPVKAWRYTER
jgi:hypothetical protein